MTTEQPPILTVLDKILQSPCYNCNEKLNCKKRIVNTNQGFICLTCNSATLVESHSPNNVTAWWSCDCGNCDYEFIESGHLYVCFPCQVDIKAGHVSDTDNVKCNKCGNDMILYNFQYL